MAWLVIGISYVDRLRYIVIVHCQLTAISFWKLLTASVFGAYFILRPIFSIFFNMQDELQVALLLRRNQFDRVRQIPNPFDI
jgi:dolichyl-phosphate-mannose--protein O-mannosyl transferase